MRFRPLDLQAAQDKREYLLFLRVRRILESRQLGMGFFSAKIEKNLGFRYSYLNNFRLFTRFFN